MTKNMYDVIKAQNGERFAKAIRNYDNGIFDIPNIDKIVKYAGRDAEPIMQYLVSLKGIKIQEQPTHQDPIELLSQAGYNAYVADTLKKQNAIQCYFATGEELCTFDDPNRFKKYYIINAVRKDIDNIKREDFKKPQREDKYGTSVISIQALKKGGHITIKNRYNHTVKNPDNTFGSNPDNIIAGLSDAIKHYFNVDFSAQGGFLPDKYVLIDNRICKYQTKIKNVYCAEDFYAKNDKIYPIDKNHEKMLENGILLNLKDKNVSDIVYGGRGSFNSLSGMRSKFVASLNKAVVDKKIRISKHPLGGYDIIVNNKQILTIKNCHIININIPNAEAIKLNNHDEFRGIFNFCDVKQLELINCDMSKITKLIMPNMANTILLSLMKMPECELDLSNVNELIISNTDLSNVTKIIMPKSMNFIAFENVIFPECNLDFSGIKSLRISGDLSRVKKIIMPRDMKCLTLGDIILPESGLDLSNITNINLSGCNLKNATNLKLSLRYQFEHNMIRLLYNPKQR